MIEVELIGSFSAAARGIVVNPKGHRKGSPICKLARQLIAAGVDPEEKLDIRRDGLRCFKPIPVSVWAGLIANEGAKSAAFQKYTLGLDPDGPSPFHANTRSGVEGAPGRPPPGRGEMPKNSAHMGRESK